MQQHLLLLLLLLLGRMYYCTLKHMLTMPAVHIMQEHLGIPATELVLVVGGRPLCACGASLPDGATLHAHLRLAGGKGGFGALLRGQGRDGKVTTNFDACRDLSGRRIRAVEAEQKLKQWEADAPGRDLEALAMKHMRELAKEARAQKREEVRHSVCLCCCVHGFSALWLRCVHS